jgi:hypothetical protein
MIRKSSVIQWNRQNAILFHETIPLKLVPLFISEGGEVANSVNIDWHIADHIYWLTEAFLYGRQN